MVWVRQNLSKELGISKDAAEMLLAKYNTRVPFVKKLAEATTQSASKVWFYKNS
jgi:DNA polymerase I-like protein with 3'-5' exonuclease and polymerase domains